MRLAWLLLLAAGCGGEETVLFNGQDLAGWQGRTEHWSVEDGVLVGRSLGDDFYYLTTERHFGDFELSFEALLVTAGSNSGVPYRARQTGGGSAALGGYQLDLGSGAWGSLYDQLRRDRYLVAADPSALATVHTGAWNRYRVRAQGKHLEHFVNDVKAIDYMEADPAIPAGGVLALQLHTGMPMEVRFRNLVVRTH